MRKSIVLKCLVLSILTFCLTEANAQLASDTPAAPDNDANKVVLNAKRDSSKTSRILASEAPILMVDKSKARESKPTIGKVVLPSEAVINNKESQTNTRKQ